MPDKTDPEVTYRGFTVEIFHSEFGYTGLILGMFHDKGEAEKYCARLNRVMTKSTRIDARFSADVRGVMDRLPGSTVVEILAAIDTKQEGKRS